MTDKTNVNMSHTKDFLTDLEGLRAIAVLAVFIFHINENWLPGGFLGVDLFFVISGYVVSKVLLANGIRGHLTDFYINRFHRLMPAALVTIIFTVVTFELFAKQLADGEFYFSALSSGLSFSNVHFFLTSDYWSDELAVNPFLHFWSLSVEEQFYLVWPVILYFIINKKVNAWKALTFLTVISVAMLFLMEILHPNASFYLMPSRMFQFVAGALAFILSRYNFGSYLRPVSFIVGIFSFISMAFLLEGNGSSIIISMVLPTISVFLVLLGLQTSLSINCLSVPLLRYLGKTSYSLYLVHWPIIVLVKLNFGITLISYLMIIFLSLASAHILHQSIEKRYRLRKVTLVEGKAYWPKRGVYISVSLFIATISSVLVGLNFSQKNITLQAVATQEDKAEEQLILNRYDGPFKTSVFGVNARDITGSYKEFAGPLWNDRKRLSKGGCLLEHKALFNIEDFELCARENGKKRLLILGDTTTTSLKIIFEQILPKENILAVGSAGCFPHYPNVTINGRWNGCQQLDDYRFSLAFREDITAIVIGGNWQHIWGSRVKAVIDHLKSTGKPVFLVGARPWFQNRVPTILDGASGDVASENLNPFLKYDPFLLEQKLKDIISPESDTVTYLSLLEYLCPNSVCKAFTPHNSLIYLDHFHLTVDAAISIGKSLGDYIVPRLKDVTGFNTEIRKNSSENEKVNSADLSDSPRKTIWSCQTYEQGRINGDENYKLSTDLNLQKCLEGEVILIGDSWGPEAAEALFLAFGPNNVATLNSAGCRPTPQNRVNRSFPDCQLMNNLRFDSSLLGEYKHVFVATNWIGWSKEALNVLINYFVEENISVYFFSPRPNFVVPVPSILGAKGEGKHQLIDLTKFERNATYVDLNTLKNVASLHPNIQIIDWYTPLFQDGVLIAVTPDGDQIYRDKGHLTPKGMKFIAEKLLDQLKKVPSQ